MWKNSGKQQVWNIPKYVHLSAIVTETWLALDSECKSSKIIKLQNKLQSPTVPAKKTLKLFPYKMNFIR
jgi:hypothetical protein